jgi:hypothetical protein
MRTAAGAKAVLSRERNGAEVTMLGPPAGSALAELEHVYRANVDP